MCDIRLECDIENRPIALGGSVFGGLDVRPFQNSNEPQIAQIFTDANRKSVQSAKSVDDYFFGLALSTLVD